MSDIKPSSVKYAYDRGGGRGGGKGGGRGGRGDCSNLQSISSIKHILKSVISYTS